MSGTEDKMTEARRKYAEAWNSTMLEMWREQITLLKVIDTGALLETLTAFEVKADGRFFQLHFAHQFNEYGLWQEFGVGREVHRGNNGDIGREKVRERKQWLSRKYWKSMQAIKEFMAESIGEEFVGVVASEVTNASTMRRVLDYNRLNHH